MIYKPSLFSSGSGWSVLITGVDPGSLPLLGSFEHLRPKPFYPYQQKRSFWLYNPPKKWLKKMRVYMLPVYTVYYICVCISVSPWLGKTWTAHAQLYTNNISVCVFVVMFCLPLDKEGRSTREGASSLVHYNNKVVSRVRNAKNRFRALSRGAVTGEKMGGLLSKLKEAKNQEEIMKDKKKVILNVFQPDKWTRYVQVFIGTCNTF